MYTVYCIVYSTYSILVSTNYVSISPYCLILLAFILHIIHYNTVHTVQCVHIYCIVPILVSTNYVSISPCCLILLAYISGLCLQPVCVRFHLDIAALHFQKFPWISINRSLKVRIKKQTFIHLSFIETSIWEESFFLLFSSKFRRHFVTVYCSGWRGGRPSFYIYKKSLYTVKNIHTQNPKF